MRPSVKHIKLAVFSLILCVSSVFFWFYLKKLFIWDFLEIQNDGIVLAVLFSVFICLLISYFILVDNVFYAISSIFIISFSSLLFFLVKDNELILKWQILNNVLISVFLFSTIFLCYLGTKKLIKKSRRFNPWQTALLFGMIVLLIFAIVISNIFFLNFFFLNSEGNFELPEDIVIKVSEPLDRLACAYFPIISMNSDVNSFILMSYLFNLPLTKGGSIESSAEISILKAALSIKSLMSYAVKNQITSFKDFNYLKMLSDKEFYNLVLGDLRDYMIKENPEFMENLKTNFSVNLNIEIESADKMSDIYTRLINSKLALLSTKTKAVIAAVPSLMLLGILIFVFTIINFIYSLISWLLIIILKALKFFRIEKEKDGKEVILFS